MSARITTLTPFIDQSILEETLNNLHVIYTVQDRNIITERVDYYGGQNFVFQNGKYSLLHDSSANREYYSYRKINFKNYNTVQEFLQAVEKEYISIEKKREEEIRKLKEELERQRLEAERQREIQRIELEKQRLESERQKAIQKIKQEQDVFELEQKKLKDALRQKEQEAENLKLAKQSLVEEQKQKIYEKAKQMGYSVKEKKKGNTVQLVLVKSVY